MTPPNELRLMIARSICDSANYLITHIQSEGDELHFHDGGDDTDYQPAAAEFALFLTYLYNHDDFSDDAFIDSIRPFFTNCASLPDNSFITPSFRCTHELPLDYHFALDAIIPSYDHCPHEID